LCLVRGAIRFAQLSTLARPALQVDERFTPETAAVWSEHRRSRPAVRGRRCNFYASETCFRSALGGKRSEPRSIAQRCVTTFGKTPARRLRA